MRILVAEGFHIPGKSENVLIARIEGKPGAFSTGMIEINEYRIDGYNY